MLCARSESSKYHSRCFHRPNSMFTKFRKMLSLPIRIQRKLASSRFSGNLNNCFRRPLNANNDITVSEDNVAEGQNKHRCSQDDICQELCCVFCKDSYQHIFQILFQTCNVRIMPLHFEARNVTDFENDKQTLTESRVRFKEVCDFTSGRCWITNRIFSLVLGRNKIGCLNGVRSNQPIKVYNSERKKPKHQKPTKDDSICATHRFPSSLSRIVLVFNGVVFQIESKVLALESIRNRLVDNRSSKFSSSDSPNIQNQAVVIAQYKKDLIQFKFDMCNVTIQPAIFKVSRACQVVDNQRFVPYYNLMTSRRVFIPVPRTIVEPNSYMNQFKGVKDHQRVYDPYWMKEVRSERMRKNDCKYNQKIKETSSVVSCISAETGGMVYRVRAGVLKIDKIKNTGVYELYVIAHQRKDMAKNWDRIRASEKAETMVPDWNMETNDL